MVLEKKGHRTLVHCASGGYNEIGEADMEYARFLMCAALGLMGVCLVLKTLLDTLLSDWDIQSDLRQALRRPSRVTSLADLILEDEDTKPAALATRMERSARSGMERDLVETP